LVLGSQKKNPRLSGGYLLACLGLELEAVSDGET
jgi:hypothetical protein